MSDRASLPDNYMAQSDFLEMTKLAIRGECNPQDLLTQCKFFTILTLKQILCQLLVNLVGTDDSEKKHKSMSIILHSTIQILQADNKSSKSSPSVQPNDKVMNEFFTEFFVSIVEKSHSMDPGLIKPYRKDIIELFNDEYFF